VKKFRILHVVGGLNLGGGQKLTALVAAGLRDAGYYVEVVNLGIHGHYGEYLQTKGVKVTDLGLPINPRLSDIRIVFRGVKRLFQILFQKPRWDIVHTHMFRTSLLCALPAKLSGSRLFGTVHRNYFKWQPLAERILAPLHESIVVDSVAVGRILQAVTKIKADRYTVIHNGIDTEEFANPPSKQDARMMLGLPLENVVITEIAHFQPHKGQHHLIAAFSKLAGEPAYLLLVGDGPTKDSLEYMSRDRGISDRVIFTGLRSELPLILAASDILALPSSFEGFGIIQAEAMYMGLPVVATNRGGSVEVVEEGETGFLVPYGDEEALASRLGQLKDSYPLRQQFGEAGRKRVIEKFTQKSMVNGYIGLYEGRAQKGLSGRELRRIEAERLEKQDSKTIEEKYN